MKDLNTSSAKVPSILLLLTDDCPSSRTYVDKEFGTGAVKLASAHDQNDSNLEKTHNFEFINIFTDNGLLNSNAGPNFEGQKRFNTRYITVEELQKFGLFLMQDSFDESSLVLKVKGHQATHQALMVVAYERAP